ncbi:hypothetical protein KPH14_011104 [Odynerus spinipes]|uniref:Uncharacterized protein n=1 Tax=Odynerus spinipes TaxID=1348599 RepID=A0AAD9VN38_9HYME|nr:hypothetical protein KPH14_011104 [Odynerus spinipes]
MDRYVSTYSKDYTWPYPVKPFTKLEKNVTFRGGPCTCGMDPKDVKVPRMYSDRLAGETQDWSRLGPMGPLLDPKLFPAKTGPSPETEETRFGQPDVYLKKLKEKYPYLYGAIQGGPTQETTFTTDEDRMITTYMMDYGGGKRQDGPTAESESKVRRPIEEPVKRDCRPHTRPPLSKFRSSALDRDGKDGDGRKKRARKSEDMDGAEVRIPPWKSEYQDSISKVGHAIIKYKLHSPEKNVVPIRLVSH